MTNPEKPLKEEWKVGQERATFYPLLVQVETVGLYGEIKKNGNFKKNAKFKPYRVCLARPEFADHIVLAHNILIAENKKEVIAKYICNAMRNVCEHVSLVSAGIKELAEAERLLQEDYIKKQNHVYILGLSIRASNILESAGINTIAQLVELTADDLLKFHSFGRGCLCEVKRKLGELGLFLRRPGKNKNDKVKKNHKA